MTLIATFLEQVQRQPARRAAVTADGALDYAALAEAARRSAAALAAAGVGRDSHVAVLLNNSATFAALLLAAADLGAVLVPLSPSLPVPALAKALRAGRCTHGVAWHGALARALPAFDGAPPLPAERWLTVGGSVAGLASFEQAAAEADPEYRLGVRPAGADQDYILTMTSGSTGAPKPIVFTQATKLNRAFAARDLYALSAADVVLAATPMYHSLAQRLVLTPLLLGGTAVIMDGFTPQKWLDWVARHRVTFCIGVSAQLQSILAALAGWEAGVDSLRTLVSSSALLKDDVKRRLIATMRCDVHECYGASEVGIVSNLNPADAAAKLSSVGRPAPGVEVRILGADGRALPPGEVGEIAARTPNRFSRYFGDAAATAAAVRDGFFLTGDLGWLDADGFLYFAGRKKELIITGGINVYPRDVEAAMLSHPKVRECAVVGVEDERLGEAVAACVVAAPGDPPSVRELQRHALRTLADFQQPLTYRFVAELPRNEMGKVMKPQVARLFVRGADRRLVS